IRRETKSGSQSLVGRRRFILQEINPEPQVRFRLNVLGKVQVNQSGIFVAVGAPTVRLKLQPESPDSGLREPVFQLSKSFRMITC
ncbi:hypothetical protein HAX54_003613, partial [Datura stramonium]|nr:hypothetical protein [Datura stramonium]